MCLKGEKANEIDKIVEDAMIDVMILVHDDANIRGVVARVVCDVAKESLRNVPINRSNVLNVISGVEDAAREIRKRLGNEYFKNERELNGDVFKDFLARIRIIESPDI